MDSSKSFYTRKEVAKLLNIKEKTVYTYAQEGKIEAAPNPYNVRRETVYTKESVDNYLNQIEKLMKEDGYTLEEASKELGISRQRINKIIGEYNIQVIKNSKVRGGVPKTIIPEASFEQLKNIANTLKNKTNKQAKSNFYSQELDIAVFQLFYDQHGDSYRVKKINGEWGFSKTLDNTFIPYKVAQDMLELTSAYPIHQTPNKQLGYAVFKLPEKHQNTLIYIDYFLSKLGVENIIIELDKVVNEQSITLHLRQSVIEIDEDTPSNQALEELKRHIVEGELVYTDTELFIIAGKRRISAIISLENFNKLTKLSIKESKDLSDVLDEILSKYFNQ